MNKVNYLFDACVSHRNTLRLQHNLDDFFSEQEARYEEWYAKSHLSKSSYDEDDEDEDDDDDGDMPKMVLDNWNKIYDYPKNVWIHHSYKRDVDIQLKPRTIQYDGYLYRWMSLNEFNKYISHTLEDNTKDWNEETQCSDNMGYCFIGKDYEYLNEWGLDMESEYLSYADEKNEIEYRLSHVGMIHENYMRIPGGNEFHPKVRTMDVLCKFYYKGEIRQCVSYYGEGFFDEWEDNWMIEYGLQNYNDLELVNARFAVYDTGLCGGGACKDESFFKLK